MIRDARCTIRMIIQHEIKFNIFRIYGFVCINESVQPGRECVTCVVAKLFCGCCGIHNLGPLPPRDFQQPSLLALVSQNALLKAYLSIYDRVVDLK